jgi:hypothetical protein
LSTAPSAATIENGPRAPSAATAFVSARGRLEQRVFDVGHQDVVAAVERVGRQVAHTATELQPPDADRELLPVTAERIPEVEGRGHVRADLVGGDPEVICRDLPPAIGLAHQIR